MCRGGRMFAPTKVRSNRRERARVDRVRGRARWERHRARVADGRRRPTTTRARGRAGRIESFASRASSVARTHHSRRSLRRIETDRARARGAVGRRDDVRSVCPNP